MVIVEGGGIKYYINNRLAHNWDRIKDGKLYKEDDDRVFDVDGRERSGKSLFTIQQCAYIDPTFIDRFMNDEPSICFSAEETLNAIKKITSTDKITKCIMFDEAFRGLSSRSVLSRTNKLIVQALMEMGQKNLVLFIVLPSFFLLDSYPAVLRSNALIHIERPRKGHGHGGRIFRVYNFKKKAWLYNLGKKAWNYPIGTNFKGQFYGKYPGGEAFEKKYRDIKHTQLLKLETTLDKNKQSKGLLQRRYLIHRNVLLKMLADTLNIGIPKLLKKIKEKGIWMDARTLRSIIDDPHDTEKTGPEPETEAR